MQSNLLSKESPMPQKPLFSGANIIERLQLFNNIYQRQEEARQQAPKQEINVQVKDKGVYQGISWQIRPIDILSQIKEKYPNEIIAAKVQCSDSSLKESKLSKNCQINADGELYDLFRPLEKDCKIEFLSFSDPQGEKIFWHSSAHILGAILEQEYGGYLCSGPPIEDGFYYDIILGGQKINPSQFQALEQKAEKFIKEGHKFRRIILSKPEALEMFKHNPVKLDIIKSKVPENGIISAYSCGSFVDLCKGPHLPSVSYAKVFKIQSAAAAVWSGHESKEEVERVHAISFPSKAEQEKHLELQKKIAESDHRNIARKQDLFFFHPASPSAGFFYPYGARLYNKLLEVLKKEYRIRGYQEVISPCMYNKSLWECSGHSHSFQKNMFGMKVEDQDFSLKPMNCPAHCLIFGSKLHSYRDLPMRLADFGVLHRNEVSGSLQGLLRVRKFQQDDSHIFCRVDQIMEEVMEVLKFMDYIYGLFGFDYKMVLSTKPDNSLGSEELWEKAEKFLAEALDKFGKPWELAPGDGAFYGPKIEVHIRDIRKRYFQCGTIQLDFVLPERFDLKYRISDHEEEKSQQEHVDSKAEGKDQSQSQEGSMLLKSKFERPVMVHRAIMGSIERFLAILIEKCQGLWPFWLSPKQIKVIPVNDRVLPYAEQVFCRLKLEGYDVEFDHSRSNVKLGKKVSEAHLERFNYAVVIGEQEVEKELASVRDLYQKKDIGKMSVVELVNFFKSVGIPSSEAEIALREKALFSKEEKLSVQKLIKYDEELKFKVLFEDDQKEPGQRDRAVYEEIKGYDVNKESMPNLYRWCQFMKKFVQN